MLFIPDIWLIIFEYCRATKLNEVCKEWNSLCQNYTETQIEKYGVNQALWLFMKIGFIPGITRIYIKYESKWKSMVILDGIFPWINGAINYGIHLMLLRGNCLTCRDPVPDFVKICKYLLQIKEMEYISTFEKMYIQSFPNEKAEQGIINDPDFPVTYEDEECEYDLYIEGGSDKEPNQKKRRRYWDLFDYDLNK